MSKSKSSVWGIVLRSIAIIFCVFMAIMSVKALMIWDEDLNDFSEKALPAEGIIVNKIYNKLSGDGDRYRSDDVVQFIDTKGDTIQFVDNTTIDFGVQIGERVPILYMPNDPEYAKIDLAEQGTNELMIGWVLGILAGVFALIAVLTTRKTILILRERKKGS